MYFYHMKRAIIIDDEQSARETLDALVKKYCSNIEVIAQCSNAFEGKEAIDNLDPDLIFLDVDMPKESGFDLLAKFNNPDFDVVFTTGHDKYAIQAIKSSALDFLLKPIDIDELRELNERFSEKKTSKADLNLQFETLLENLKNDKKKKIAIPDADGIRFVDVNEIIRCEAAGNYTQVVINTKESLLSNKSLRDFESLLGDNNFIRIHQSHLVCLDKVKKYVKNDGNYVIMVDGSKVDVSRRRKALLDEEIAHLL